MGGKAGGLLSAGLPLVGMAAAPFTGGASAALPALAGGAGAAGGAASGLGGLASMIPGLGGAAGGAAASGPMGMLGQAGDVMGKISPLLQAMGSSGGPGGAGAPPPGGTPQAMQAAQMQKGMADYMKNPAAGQAALQAAQPSTPQVAQRPSAATAPGGGPMSGGLATNAMQANPLTPPTAPSQAPAAPGRQGGAGGPAMPAVPQVAQRPRMPPGMMNQPMGPTGSQMPMNPQLLRMLGGGPM